VGPTSEGRVIEENTCGTQQPTKFGDGVGCIGESIRELQADGILSVWDLGIYNRGNRKLE
jgi:hypothetical protein